MDYSAVGQTTHLAARMEQLATPGTTRLTGETLALAEGFVHVVPLGPIPVKGVASPWRCSSWPARRRRARACRQRPREGSPASWGATGNWITSAKPSTRRGGLRAGRRRGGRARRREIASPLGVHPLAPHAGLARARISSVSYGKATAYLPVIDLCRSYFGIEARDDARSIREKVTGKLLTLDESLRAVVPGFLSLLDVPTDDAAWDALDPGQRRRRTVDGLRRMLLRESQVQPVCVVFEDLHWVDAESQGLLDALVEGLPTARLLLLVNYRPEYSHGWGSKTYYSQLRLDPLASGER